MNHGEIINLNKTLKVYWTDKECTDTGYSLERYSTTLHCDTCNKIGSYYVIGEKYKIGLCYGCLDTSTSIKSVEVLTDNGIWHKYKFNYDR